MATEGIQQRHYREIGRMYANAGLPSPVGILDPFWGDYYPRLEAAADGNEDIGNFSRAGLTTLVGLDALRAKAAELGVGYDLREYGGFVQTSLVNGGIYLRSRFATGEGFAEIRHWGLPNAQDFPRRRGSSQEKLVCEDVFGGNSQSLTLVFETGKYQASGAKRRDTSENRQGVSLIGEFTDDRNGQVVGGYIEVTRRTRSL